MLPKNIRTLKRSISEKILGKPAAQKNEPCAPTRTVSNASTASTVSQPEENDPYREILRMYDDNVSHLVLHGSSLRSMTSR